LQLTKLQHDSHHRHRGESSTPIFVQRTPHDPRYAEQPQAARAPGRRIVVLPNVMHPACLGTLIRMPPCRKTCCAPSTAIPLSIVLRNLLSCVWRQQHHHFQQSAPAARYREPCTGLFRCLRFRRQCRMATAEFQDSKFGDKLPPPLRGTVTKRPPWELQCGGYLANATLPCAPCSAVICE